MARVAIALRLEFSGRDHPVGRALDEVSAGLVMRCGRLITAGRRAGSIPPGPPATTVAAALVGAIEGTVIALAGRAPHDELHGGARGGGRARPQRGALVSEAGSKFAGSAGS